MSRFAQFRSGVREKVTNALGIESREEEPAEPTAEELAKEEDESRKHEYRLMIILEKVREMYYQRGLVGSVDISRSFLFTCNDISCDIDGTGTPEVEPAVEHASAEVEKVPMLVKLTIKNVTRLLNRLETRAKNYKTKSYKDDLTISGSINICDPMGFTSVSISCSATLSSLLSNEKKA
jgi:hypothetical protein